MRTGIGRGTEYNNIYNKCAFSFSVMPIDHSTWVRGERETDPWHLGSSGGAAHQNCSNNENSLFVVCGWNILPRRFRWNAWMYVDGTAVKQNGVAQMAFSGMVYSCQAPRRFHLARFYVSHLKSILFIFHYIFGMCEKWILGLKWIRSR